MNYTYKQIGLINLPVMMSILTEQLINITDALFLGHVGEIELGASAMAGIYYLAVYMLGFGFSIGLQVMIARRNGEQALKETGRTFFQGLFFLSGLAFLLALFLHFLSPLLLKPLISSEEIYQAVVQYLNWRSLGLLFSFPFLAIRSFLAIEHLGEEELALSNIIRSVSTLFFILVSSLALTTGSLVSNALGEGNAKALFPICRKILLLGYALGLPLIGTALACHQGIVGWYTDNRLLIQSAFLPFAVMLLNYMFALPGYVYLNALSGIGKTRVTFLFQLTTTFVYLGYLYVLSYCSHADLALYLTVEYLFVIMLGAQSIIYLKKKQY